MTSAWSLVLIPTVVLAGGATFSPEALAQYQQATASIQAGEYGKAITTLNALAADYPRVAEIFAARCSAQVSMQRYAGAEADCTYALSLKSQLPSALYALALSEESLGKRDAAAQHFRSYAAYDVAQAPYREQALARAGALAASQPTQPPLVGATTGNPAAAQPAAASSTLIVYRNHTLAGSGRITLVLDNRLVGDFGYGQYVEIQTSPGEHLLEARAQVNDVFEVPRVWTQPVQLGGAPLYLNFDTSGGQIVLQEVPTAQARQEVRDDCTKAYARHIGPDSPEAPPISRPPSVVVAHPMYAPPGTYVVGAPARGCRFSSDCGDSSEYSCRTWRSGQVCMGHGYTGAPCWFSSDCVSGTCDIRNKVCR